MLSDLLTGAARNRLLQCLSYLDNNYGLQWWKMLWRHMRGFPARFVNDSNISGVSSAPWRHFTATLESDKHTERVLTIVIRIPLYWNQWNKNLMHISCLDMGVAVAPQSVFAIYPSYHLYPQSVKHLRSGSNVESSSITARFDATFSVSLSAESRWRPPPAILRTTALQILKLRAEFEPH